MVNEEFLSAGVHIGKKQKTKDMEKFIFKIRPDGLSVLNVQSISDRVKIAAKFLARSKNIIVVSRKDIGQKAVAKFSEIIEAKAITGRFLPGIITNPSFRKYMEPDVLVVSDPIKDKQAITEAVKMRIPIVALCDTINETNYIDFVIPANNSGRKSVAAIYYILAKEILKERGKIKTDEEFTYKLEDFIANEDEVRTERSGERGEGRDDRRERRTTKGGRGRPSGRQ